MMNEDPTRGEIAVNGSCCAGLLACMGAAAAEVCTAPTDSGRPHNSACKRLTRVKVGDPSHELSIRTGIIGGIYSWRHSRSGCDAARTHEEKFKSGSSATRLM